MLKNNLSMRGNQTQFDQEYFGKIEEEKGGSNKGSIVDRVRKGGS